MARLGAKRLASFEANRNIGDELLTAAREIKAGRAARVHPIKMPEVLEARVRTGLSPRKFAQVLGISTRTLDEWEQGRGKPTGAAWSLLIIGKRRPEVLRELFA
jgi:putative transcriptional regulator